MSAAITLLLGAAVATTAFSGPLYPEPFLFAQGFAGAGERAFAVDLDGDGFADLVTPAGDGTIWVARNELGQRMHGAERWAEGFAALDEPVAAGNFLGNGRAALVALRRSGALALARPDAPGARFEILNAAGEAPVSGDVRLVAADLEGRRIDDLVILCGGVDGAPAEVFAMRSNGRGGFEPARLIGTAPRDAAICDVDGDGRADLVWLTRGALMVSRAVHPPAPVPSPSSPARASLHLPAAPWGAAERVALSTPGPVLAAGCADTTGRAALALPGAWVKLEGGATLTATVIPDPRLRLSEGACAVLADIDGDGALDFVTFTRRDRCDVIVALARLPGWYGDAPPGSKDTDGDGLTDFEEMFIYHTNPLVRDTDHDGLLDGWEAKGTFRGVRLDRMGANPLHKDIFLELDVEEGAPPQGVEAAIRRMERLYRDAPVENPDGVSGIDIHCVVDTVVPRWPKPAAAGASAKPGAAPIEAPPGRQELRELFFTPGRAGIFHWMYLDAEGGGGQADLLADQGACAQPWEATLPHEFGHQLGLNHGGRDGMNGIPHYPSLMNYAYSYQLGGRGDAIDYSRGALAHLSLDENALPERLAVPFEKLAYLAGPPFHFRVEPREGGNATWVDWNRDAIEQATAVRANINAAAGEGYGPRELIDKLAPLGSGKTTRTLEQPALVSLPETAILRATEGTVAVPETLILLYVPKEGGGLAMRALAEDDWTKWGPEVRIAEAPADLHEISACADGSGDLHVVGTAGGRVVELIGSERSPERGFDRWTALGHDWDGVPAIAADGRDLCVVSRRADGSLAGRRNFRAPVAPGAQGPQDTCVDIAGVRSSCPAALAMDTLKHELLVATSDPGSDRMRLSRLDPATLKLVSTELVGGEKAGDATNQRAAILFATAPWLPKEGEVDIYVAGRFDWRNGDPANCTHLFRCYTIGDKSWLSRNGWKCDETWNEWTYTLSGVGAAWFHGRPWHAGRFYTFPVWDPQGLKDTIAIGPNADGICDRDLRDTNDWDIITSIGLERSILQSSTPRGRR